MEKTNGDLIRGMTDEELAVTLMCPNEMGMADIEGGRSNDCNCCKCLLDWIKQEAPQWRLKSNTPILSSLARVMERMGATDVHYDWTRHMAFVEFRLKGSCTALAKPAHPDGGGDDAAFIALQEATKRAVEHLERGEQGGGIV